MGRTFPLKHLRPVFRQQGGQVWHIPFFWIPHLPEMLIRAHERSWELLDQGGDLEPHAITDEAISEWIAALMAPGGLRGCRDLPRRLKERL